MSNPHSSVDESTPLLFHNDDWEALLPSISEALVGDTVDFRHAFRTADDIYQAPVPVIAFELLVVLYHLKSLNGSAEDLRRARLAEMSIKLFNQIVKAVETVDDSKKRTKFGASLTYKFKLDPLASRYLCILECLDHYEIPQEILTSEILTNSIKDLWQTDFTNNKHSLDTSRLQRLDNFIRSPHILHCIHLISHILYLLSLSYIILYPSSVFSGDSYNPTTIPYIIWIILYSISDALFNFTFTSVLRHIIVIVSILSRYQPESLAHTVLLVMLGTHIIRMHFPGYPTHLLLFNPSTFIPVSTFFNECFKRSLIPSLVFLLPMISAFSVLLSLSLSDSPSLHFGTNVIHASPLSVRTGLLIFFATSILLFICLAGALIVHFPNSPNGTRESTRWDKFGIEHGIIARRFLIRAIITYSTTPRDNILSLTYPPPFNIAGYLLFPLSAKLFPQLYVISWYLIVGPVAFTTAGIWLWGALT